MNMSSSTRQRLWLSGVVFALLFIAFAAVAIGKESGLVAHVESKRWVGVLMALMMAVSGNVLPKLLRSGVNSDRSDRLVGWGLVGTGTVVAAVLVVLPSAWIPAGAAAMGLGAFAIVGALLAWPIALGQDRHRPTDTETSMSLREGVLQVLLAIWWAFAMMFADVIWDDGLTMWMICGYFTSSMLLVVLLRRRGQSGGLAA